MGSLIMRRVGPGVKSLVLKVPFTRAERNHSTGLDLRTEGGFGSWLEGNDPILLSKAKSGRPVAVGGFRWGGSVVGPAMRPGGPGLGLRATIRAF
jgi:hypothetical protein